jgi:4,5-DOPA dioxygenase extradiol
MKRMDFIRSLALLPVAGFAMELEKYRLFLAPEIPTENMPVLFVGHGSPMNAIEDNEFTNAWKRVSGQLPVPQAIICISAHWETKGTFVTAMENPKTIHDFGGFPQSLYDVQYPAKGNTTLASSIVAEGKIYNIQPDHTWGLDHGAWSVIKVMYPEANIPVLQLSIDYTKSAEYHYNLAKELSDLRKKGVLFIGSGNMVHNLRAINWRLPEQGFDWAIEANELFKKLILTSDAEQLIRYTSLGKAIQLSVPTPEHFLPLIYALGLATDRSEIEIFNDKTIMGSISMTSVLFQ